MNGPSLRVIQPVPGAVLDVVAVVSNPARFNSRFTLYRHFEKHMKDSGVRLTTVELQQGDRAFEITEANNPRHLQLRTYHELWHKENLINLGIARLPSDWEYVAWVDADLTFNRPDWAYETVHQLQHFDIVQPFSHTLNLGPKSEPIFDSHRVGEKEQRKVVVSWLYAHFNQIPQNAPAFGPGHRRRHRRHHKPPWLGGSVHEHAEAYESEKAVGTHVWHSGFAWAARRSAINTIGGLLDWAILGSADRHMAEMMTRDPTWNANLSPGYKKALDLKAERFAKLNGNFGYCDGLVTHHWHGKLVNRRYLDRWKILFNHQFDPITDLYRDEQGLWQLTESKPQLRDDVRRYMRAREEDSIDV